MSDFNWPEARNRVRFHDFTPFELEVCSTLGANTIASPEAIVSLVRAVQHILHEDIRGDFVQCGVYKGGSASIMLETQRKFSYTFRTLWLYDTFEGFPKPGAEDVQYKRGSVLATWQSRNPKPDGTGSDWLKFSEDEVRANLAHWHGDCEVVYIKGMVEDTIPDYAPSRIALAHFDTDFYSSTRHQFLHLWDRVSAGGIVVVDDYGCFEGCRRATDEFLDALSVRPFLHRVDEHVRLLVKP